jgi:D-glycero-alpha-D-manno-heptose-7-phosphate kinase
MTAALVCAVARLVALPISQRQIAEIACEIEIDLLGRPIGRQDQYAAALGGINTLTFSQDGVEVVPLPLSPEIACALHQHLLLVSTRKTRDSATLLQSQRAASGNGGDVSERLHRIKALALAMREALLAGDLVRFGALLDESWQLKRGLTQGVTSPQIDRWYALARCRGAYGGKITGAGGGGFFLFCVPPARRDGVLTALRAEGLTPFPIAFDHRGCAARDEPRAQAPQRSNDLKGGSDEAAPANSI